jgi:hypothetical protein
MPGLLALDEHHETQGLWLNPRTGKGWTDEEEQVFAEIMRAGRLERLPAIRLYKRCRSNASEAVTLARECYGLSEEQLAAYERTKSARLAGLVKARQQRAQNRRIQQTELAA